MNEQSTSQSGQFSLPETIYENALRNGSIEPNPILIGIVRKMHSEQLTTNVVTASLKEYGKYNDDKPDLAAEEISHFDYYKEAVAKAGLIPDLPLIRIVARRHMQTLNPNLLIKAYVEFRSRYPQGCDNGKKGGQS